MTDQRLSGLDASFLQLERGPAHMHVASTTIFSGIPPHPADFRDHVASRLHLVPRFRQKLRFVPYGGGRPIWVDDPHLNLDYHVRATALPAPGSDEQLRNLAGRIFSQRLDRSKPVWEMWLVEGLTDDRFAIISKTHHCLVDGVSGIDITTVLFDAEAEPPAGPGPAPEWVAAPEPSEAQLLGEALLERATSPAEIARSVARVARAPRRALVRAVDGLEAMGAFAKTGIAAPPSPFNVEIGPHRRFATVTAPLSEFKRIKNHHGGTVNDVVLAAVSGASRRYLARHGHDVDSMRLRAMVPISVRPDDQHGALGNRVSAFQAPLPVWAPDPEERLAEVTRTMGDLKASKQAVGATMMTELADLAPPTIAGQAARLQAGQRFFNLVVTNIPGPQFPIYLMGRKLERLYPMVPLAKRQAVCFGIMSYDGNVSFGIVGDRDAIPDIDDLAADLREAIDELLSISPAAESPETPPADQPPARSRTSNGRPRESARS